MLSRRSRYALLEDTVHPDRFGGLRRTKSLRPLPPVDGQFQHTVESNDRLDHLAYKYHRQSLQWWRICDANPGFLSPRELLGKVPQESLEMQLQWRGALAPWHLLFDTLAGLIGVEAVVKGGESGGEPQVLVDEATILFTLAEPFRAQLDEAVATQTLPPALDTALQAEGLVLVPPLRVAKPGEQRWQIEVAGDGTRYLFSYSDTTNVVTAFDTVVTHSWDLIVVFNDRTLAREQLIAVIGALGFTVIDPHVLTRIGQRIVIPPRFRGT